MSQEEHEHDEGDEAAGAPVTPDDDAEAQAEEEESHDAETGRDEPTEAKASGPQSDREVKALSKKIDGERERHAKKLGDILGDAAPDALPCPLCFEGLQGFVIPQDLDTITDEQREVLWTILGEGGPRHLNDAKGVHECEACSGFGLLAFPTKVPHVKEQQCPACQGSGYVLDQQREAVPLYVAQQSEATTTITAPTVPACPTCGMAGMAGVPHFCNPVAASG